MAGEVPNPTISLGERSLPAVGSGEKLSKWLTYSLFLHTGLIVALFLLPSLPSPTGPNYPVYTVDLIGGEKIGGTNFGTQLTPPPPPKEVIRKVETKPPAPVPEVKREPKKEKAEKIEKPKPKEKPPKVQEKVEKVIVKENTKVKEIAKSEPAKSESTTAVKSEAKGDEALDQLREKLIQSAVERARNRTEAVQQPSKGDVISSGGGEGEGAAALGPGGRGGGIVKGMEFIIYQNQMLSTIKGNWAWVGQKSDLRVVVRFQIRDSGEIVGLKIMQPSGDRSYDESVLRAVKKSSPLPAPPEMHRKEFAEVELTFRPKDLGA